eukprot:gene2532-3135_t
MSLIPCNCTVCYRCIQPLLGSEGQMINCPSCSKQSTHIFPNQMISTTISKLKDNLKSESPCRYHRGKSLFSYCTRCKVPVCVECVLASHNGHPFSDLDRNDFANLMSDIKIKIEKQYPEIIAKELQPKEQFFQQLQKQTEDYFGSQSNELFSVFEQLHLQLSLRELELRKQIELSYRNNSDQIGTKISLIKQTINQFKSVGQLLNSQYQNKFEEVFRRNKYDVLQEFHYAESLIKDYVNDHTAIMYNYEFDKQENTIDHITQLIKSLGIISSSTYFNLTRDIAEDADPGDGGGNRQDNIDNLNGIDINGFNYNNFQLQQPQIPQQPQQQQQLPNTINLNPQESGGLGMSQSFRFSRGHTETTVSSSLLSASTSSIGVDFNERYQTLIAPSKKQMTKEIIVLGGMFEKTHLNKVFKLEVGENDVWTEYPPTICERACVSSSIVATDKRMYIFGGNDRLDNFESFDFQKKLWGRGTIPIGGSSICAVYDKKKTIFLIGGIKNNKTLDRIELFNIDTNQIDTMGGTQKSPGQTNYTVINNIEVFNPNNGEGELFEYQLDDLNQRIESCCFDNQSTLYYITTNSFRSYSLSTKQSKDLKYPQLKSNFKFGLSLNHVYTTDGIEYIQYFKVL